MDKNDLPACLQSDKTKCDNLVLSENRLKMTKNTKPKIIVTSDIILRKGNTIPEYAQIFEDLLLQKVQQNTRGDTKNKKTRITTGAEVITQCMSQEILKNKTQAVLQKKIIS